MTKYYDRDGRRIPSPRNDRVPSSGYAAALFLVSVLVIGAVVAWVYAERRAQMERKSVPATPTHDSLTVNYTYDGEAIRWYVMTDPDTNVQYLVNDRGGCCKREDRDEG